MLSLLSVMAEEDAVNDSEEVPSTLFQSEAVETLALKSPVPSPPALL